MKPPALFDRDHEWAEMEEFVADPSPGARLAIVYGRRRQGKTMLLELLCEAHGGFLFSGLEQSAAQNLADLGAAYASFRGLGAPVRFDGWPHALEEILALGEAGAPVPVVFDEFSYLVATAPELPSVIQNALSPRGRARQRSRARLVLCGSALSVMRGLLGGTAPLRGRAARELVLHPFDYRAAAAFWGLEAEWETAVKVHALVGGTPAYLDYSGGDVPRSARDLDGWVVRHLLNPASAFFREGRVLLAQEPAVTDYTLYFSVLTVLSEGKTRRGEIAAALGRKESALAHPLTVLEEARLVARLHDPLRERRSTYRIAEPMLRLHQLVIQPFEGRLARRAGPAIWAQRRETVASQIYGPHFEDLAREWAEAHAAPETLGGQPIRVGRSAVACAEHRSQHEIDIVVTGNRGVLALGEAKWRSQPVGSGELERLRHVRDLLVDAAGARLLVFARGFTKALSEEARRSRDIELVDLARLYTGS